MRDRRIHLMVEEMEQAAKDFESMLTFDHRADVRQFDAGRLEMLELIIYKLRVLGYRGGTGVQAS